METRFVHILFFLAGVLFFGEAQANSLLASPNPNPGQKFPAQGDCLQNGINLNKVDFTLSTIACSGASQQMLRISYSEGPQECVYIDNFNRERGELRAFFVPLRTSDEWIAFSSYLPGGVRLRYGCPGQIFKDSCGNAFGLPDMPSSDDPNDVIKISTPGGYNGEFSCPMTLDDGKKRSMVGGCGAWKLVKESGSCVPAVMSDVSAPLPAPADSAGLLTDTGALDTTGMTVLPEQTGILPAAPPAGLTTGGAPLPGF